VTDAVDTAQHFLTLTIVHLSTGRLYVVIVCVPFSALSLRHGENENGSMGGRSRQGGWGYLLVSIQRRNGSSVLRASFAVNSVNMLGMSRVIVR